ncbi:hypothetical protein HYPP_02916 [Hyphomicrobium sp. ghe19]|nr:hypothetical protein HYPP_02916 [Hyphomicrobium sp. ghe19]
MGSKALSLPQDNRAPAPNTRFTDPRQFGDRSPTVNDFPSVASALFAGGRKAALPQAFAFREMPGQETRDAGGDLAGTFQQR